MCIESYYKNLYTHMIGKLIINY